MQLIEAMQNVGMSLDNDTAAAAMRTVAAAREHQQAKRLLSSCRALGLQPSDKLVAVFITPADSGTGAHAELVKFIQGLGIQVSAAKRSKIAFIAIPPYEFILLDVLCSVARVMTCCIFGTEAVLKMIG